MVSSDATAQLRRVELIHNDRGALQNDDYCRVIDGPGRCTSPRLAALPGLDGAGADVTGDVWLALGSMPGGGPAGASSPQPVATIRRVAEARGNNFRIMTAPVCYTDWKVYLA